MKELFPGGELPELQEMADIIHEQTHKPDMMVVHKFIKVNSHFVFFVFFVFFVLRGREGRGEKGRGAKMLQTYIHTDIQTLRQSGS